MQIPGASSTKARGPGGQARRLWVLGGGGGPAVSARMPVMQTASG